MVFGATLWNVNEFVRVCVCVGGVFKTAGRNSLSPREDNSSGSEWREQEARGSGGKLVTGFNQSVFIPDDLTTPQRLRPKVNLFQFSPALVSD